MSKYAKERYTEWNHTVVSSLPWYCRLDHTTVAIYLIGVIFLKIAVFYIIDDAVDQETILLSCLGTMIIGTPSVHYMAYKHHVWNDEKCSELVTSQLDELSESAIRQLISEFEGKGNLFSVLGTALSVISIVTSSVALLVSIYLHFIDKSLIMVLKQLLVFPVINMLGVIYLVGFLVIYWASGWKKRLYVNVLKNASYAVC